MNLDAVLKTLSLAKYKEVFDKAWRESEELPGTMEFLTEKYLTESIGLAGINAKFVQHIFNAAEIINQSIPLKRLFAHARYLLFAKIRRKVLAAAYRIWMGFADSTDSPITSSWFYQELNPLLLISKN